MMKTLIVHIQLAALAEQMAAMSAQVVEVVQGRRSLDERLAELDRDLVLLESSLDDHALPGCPRNRRERRAARFGHRAPKYGIPAWKGNK